MRPRHVLATVGLLLALRAAVSVRAQNDAPGSGSAGVAEGAQVVGQRVPHAERAAPQAEGPRVAVARHVGDARIEEPAVEVVQLDDLQQLALQCGRGLGHARRPTAARHRV